MNDVDAYLQKLPSTQKNELERIRKIIKQSFPDSLELISYGVPGFKYKNKYLVGYAAAKNHMSLFPTSHPIIEFSNELTMYKTSRGTIRFSAETALPRELIIKLVTVRMNDICLSSTE